MSTEVIARGKIADMRREPHPTSPSFDRLMSPLKVGAVTLKNRIVFGPHGTGFATDGNVGDRHIAYHLERARGGVGLIVLEATSIDGLPIGISSSLGTLRNVDDTVLPAYRKIADVLHAEGTKVFCLLSHSGRINTMAPDGAPAKAPSPLPMDRAMDIPHELEVDEIKTIIQQFASAARRCRDGGLDGASLSFAHGNLIQSFISPASNIRTDEYGGSEEKRLRFPRELLQACRAEVGPDFVLGIRFSASEIVPDGYSIDDGVRYAKLFQDWGKLDFIDVSAGTNASMWSRAKHYPTIAEPDAPLVPLAAAVKKAVSVPVFVVGKIYDPTRAAAVINDGHADAVVMVRAQIAEPELANKIAQGQFDEIRECVYCNESCFGRQQRFGDITCVYNQRTGREGIWPPLAPAKQAKNVTIVGAGPAGLEAARVAARKGHNVVLFEKDTMTGGQLRLAGRTPHRSGYLKILEWLDRKVAKAGVDVRLGVTATVDDILATKPDAVFIATGSADTPPPHIEGADRSNVHSGRQVLAGKANLGKRIVIGDWDGRHQAASVAEYLALKGHAIDLVSTTFFIGQDVDLLTWRPLYERLLNLGVKMYPLHELVGVTDDGAQVRSLDHETRTLPADDVILCSRGVSERSLYRELKGRVHHLQAIGDCWAPRQLEQAIYEGAKRAREFN